MQVMIAVICSDLKATPELPNQQWIEMWRRAFHFFPYIKGLLFCGEYLKHPVS